MFSDGVRPYLLTRSYRGAAVVAGLTYLKNSRLAAGVAVRLERTETVNQLRKRGHSFGNTWTACPPAVQRSYPRQYQTAAVDTSNHISATPVHIHISSSTPAATTKSTVPFSQPSCEGAEEEEEDGVKLLMVVDKPASRAVKARFPDDLVSSSAPVGSSCSPIRVHSKTTKSDAESSDTSDSVAEIGRVTKNPGVGVRVVTPVQLNRFVSK